MSKWDSPRSACSVQSPPRFACQKPTLFFVSGACLVFETTKQDFREMFCVGVKKNVARLLDVIITFIRT